MNFYEKRVRRLLTDIHRIEQRQYFKGDYGATEDLVDLECAIEQAELTDKQAESIRLVFVKDLEQAEAAQKMDVSQPNISLHISSAIKKIAKYYETTNEGTK